MLRTECVLVAEELKKFTKRISMTTIILASVFAVVWLVSLVVFVVVYKKKQTYGSTDGEAIDLMFKNQKEQNLLLNNMIMQAMKNSEISTQNTINGLSVTQKQEFESISKRVDELTLRNEQRIEKLTMDVNNSLKNMREENDKAIEKMRETVDEKLNNSLSQRLNDSFSKIQQSLESVNLGIGEMRTLAHGVGDLKKVLSNVKVRGGWGEVMLSTLLEQMLAPNQYMAQVQVKKNSRERVDFAVIMPGKDGHEVLLPIDSKFPLEDYNKLLEASETLDKDLIEKSTKQLTKRIKEEAKSIKDKYISVPETTDFAVMFLPIEGLYAEVVRDIELMDTLQNQYKVVVCGPTTLTALLNSLQLGFKTLYIEKRSSELWQVLSTFKQEFEKFVQLLLKTQSKLGEANSTIELATKSSKKIAKKLGDVSQVVGIEYDDSDDDENPMIE
ncbi:MAG: DNA recombination protein RmuC [Clostridiales bacterium]|nr:DNA recombination protein RmuC [Clostridiales bacterium]